MIRNNIWGIIAVITGIFALGCAVAPDYLYGKDMQNQAPSVSPKKSFTIKGVTISFGKDRDDPETRKQMEAFQRRVEIRKYLKITSLVLAVAAFLITPFAWIREKNKVLSIAAPALSVSALAWKAIVMGIGAAVMAVILVLVLVNLDF